MSDTATEAVADIRGPPGRTPGTRGDAAAYAAEFTPDASYVAFTGDVMSGQAAIEEVHRWLFEGPLRGSRMTWSTDERDIRMVHPGVAVVVSSGGVQPAEAAELTADRASVQTSVLVEEDGGWRVAASRTPAASRPGRRGSRPADAPSLPGGRPAGDDGGVASTTSPPRPT